MAIYLRGDSEPIRAIRKSSQGDAYAEIWMRSDALDEVPIVTQRARLVADGGANEIDEALAAVEGPFNAEPCAAHNGSRTCNCGTPA